MILGRRKRTKQKLTASGFVFNYARQGGAEVAEFDDIFSNRETVIGERNLYRDLSSGIHGAVFNLNPRPVSSVNILIR